LTGEARRLTRRGALGAAVLVAAGAGGWWGLRRFTGRRPDFADQPYGEGARQVLDVYLPEGPGPFPFVVDIHGGAFRMGSKTMHPPSEQVLSAGFAIVRPNYRLSDTDLWPAQLDDCLAATALVLDRAADYGLAADRFALWGQSAGGFLAVSTALSLIEAGHPPRAVIDFFGPMDFSTMDADMAALGREATMGATDAAESAESQLLGFAVESDREAARAVGPVGRLDAMAPRPLPPLFVRHGDADPLIAHGQSERLAAAWSRVDPAAEIDLALVAGAGHGGGDFDTAVVLDPMLAFLGRHLATAG
jgi:acetyl esterase/lipase